MSDENSKLKKLVAQLEAEIEAAIKDTCSRCRNSETADRSTEFGRIWWTHGSDQADCDAHGILERRYQREQQQQEKRG